MPPVLKLNAVAFVSAHNHPILIRTFAKEDDAIKYHYIAHTSLDVVEERSECSLKCAIRQSSLLQSVAAAGKECECYLGLLFAMEDVAVYGYVTPLKVKIIVALPLSDAVVKDAEIIMVSIMDDGRINVEEFCRYSRRFTWHTILPFRTLS
jgi:hypothetical protein